jgi:hypothetical protein
LFKKIRYLFLFAAPPRETLPSRPHLRVDHVTNTIAAIPTSIAPTPSAIFAHSPARTPPASLVS